MCCVCVCLCVCMCLWVCVFACAYVCVCVCVCVCVFPPLRLLIISGIIWTSYDWINKFYSCYMATVVVIVNGCGLGIGKRCRH